VQDSQLARLLEPVLADPGMPPVPGMAVGVLSHGKAAFACAGVTNVEHPLRVDADTAFQVGSVTKPWTAGAVLRLVEKGLLDLDRPVVDLVPSLELADKAATRTITARHLLSHTAGFDGDHFYAVEADFGRRDALAAVVDALAQAPSLVPPGTVAAYSNAGFFLLGRIVEILTDRPFGEAVRDLLIAPLGLEHTSFYADELVTHRVAAGHAGTPASVVRPWYRPHFSWPAGGLVSSARDQLTWAAMHLTGADGPLSAESIQLMQTPQTPGLSLGEAVGISWMLHDVEGRRLVNHGGSTTGIQTRLTFVPDSNVAWVILGNAEEAGERIVAIDRLLRQEVAGIPTVPPASVALPDDVLVDYVGRYDGSELKVDVTSVDGLLELDAGHLRIRVAGTSTADRFIAVEPSLAQGFSVTFVRDPDGSVSWVSAMGRLLRRQPQFVTDAVHA
jgi:CubicO group peptidase (beta-lactamase class C family)